MRWVISVAAAVALAAAVTLGGIASGLIRPPVVAPQAQPRHYGAPVPAHPVGHGRPVRRGRQRAGADTGRWVPAPGTPWQWQLTTPVDQSVNAPVYDIDGFENSDEVVDALRARGRKVICYLDVGAAENFRPDYASFPARVLGKTNGWPGERYLDIRRIDVIGPIMAKRFDMCRAKGFDAIEADVVDGYANDTGFPLTAADQIAYNRYLARLAHQRGLSVALKNDVEQVPSLVGDFDFSIDEQCAEYAECDGLLPFIRARKAVLETEYNLPNSAFCPRLKALGFSAMRKTLALDARRWPC
jgi:hypothetical protein